MDKGWSLTSGICLGAGLMYLLDPNRGKRRRALLRDQLVHAWHETTDAMDTTARDLSNRTRGAAAKLRSRLTQEEVTDEVLVERVRSRLGHVVSHPRSIGVTAHEGRVTLTGPILATEADDLLSSASAVRGVTSVEDRLERHQQADNVPGLQGAGAGPGEQRGLVPRDLSPTARFLVGTTGGALVVYGTRRRDRVGTLISTLGLGMLAGGAHESM